MIISCSRRTDVPAFYSHWLMNRLDAGSCVVGNPFNPSQRSVVSLRREDVDAIVFWTKDAEPMLQHLPQLSARGYPFYFHYTITGYGAPLEPRVPPLARSIETLAQLSDAIGPERVIWRYDPIIISDRTGWDYHRRRFDEIARALRGRVCRVVVSFLDIYRKTRRNIAAMEEPPDIDLDLGAREELGRLIASLVRTAGASELEIASCAEKLDLAGSGVEPGSCVDGALIEQLSGARAPARAKGQRELCRCVESRDIGAYDTCLHGCRYCYATASHEATAARAGDHDPESPSLARKREE